MLIGFITKFEKNNHCFRLSTIKKADKIIAFKEGRIVEEGDHESLLKIENGVYSTLNSIQTISEDNNDEKSDINQFFSRKEASKNDFVTDLSVKREEKNKNYIFDCRDSCRRGT